MVTSARRWVAGALPHGVPAMRTVLRAGLGRAFGAPAFDPSADPGDPGLFGPGSASWRVIGDAAAIVGGIRALLVQLLHPHAMAGVAEHSRFRDDPLGRLHRTSAYVTATALGSTSEALAVARAVRHVHHGVRGVAADGRPYRADDPHLLAWVSVALTSSFLAADRAYAAQPADATEADAFVAEQSRVGALLDPRVDLDALAEDEAALQALRAGELSLPMLVDGLLPTTVAELNVHLAVFRAELAVDAQGREALRFLAWPPLPLALRAAYLPMLAGAVATLEPWQRRLLGLPASRLASWPLRVNTDAWLTAFRLSVGGSPSVDAAHGRVARR